MSINLLNAIDLTKILLEISNLLKLDTKEIETHISNVKKSDITYLPIRHHSPGSSILVKKWIEKYEPKLVLIEGPSLANDLMTYMIDNDTIPPLAILSIFADHNNNFGLNGITTPDPSIPAKFQIYYPFVSYSPELIAISECLNKNIPIYFIDLPLTGIITSFTKDLKDLNVQLTQEENKFVSSSFYKKLVKVFEFDNFNEMWETLFEIGANYINIEQLRENILLFCSCVRQTIEKNLLESDGSLARESFMKFNIEKYIKKHNIDKKDVLVITGGLHSIVLPCTVAKNFKFPTSGVMNSLVPYSYLRLCENSGYGSGNHAPQFYNYVWQKIKNRVENPFEVVALEIITDIFKKARNKGYLISVSDSINAFQCTKMLGMLRRRSEPGLKDIIDAIHITLVKGNPEIEGKYLDQFIHDITIGYKVGKITKKIGKLALQADFYMQLEAFGIEFKEKSKEISLNLREEKDIKISKLFWRIKFLGVSFLERVYGPDILKGATGIFTEIWSIHWNPKIDTKLIELNVYGSTVEEASKNMLMEETKKNVKDFAIISTLLFQSLLMGFTDQFHNLYNECMDSLEQDNQLLTLSKGFFNLLMINHYVSMIENQKNNISFIKGLIQRCYFSCCFTIPNFANPPHEMEESIVNAIKNLANSFISAPEIDIDLNVFIESINSCIDNTDNEFLKGANLGILYLMNEIEINNLKEFILDYANSIDSIQIRVGDLVRGIIFVCQAKILFNRDIIKLLSDLVESVEWNIFSAILPAMRKTFSELERRVYEIFVEKIAEYYGLKESKFKEITDEVEDSIVIFFGDIDKKVRNIFEEWFGEV
ncbi:MAG: DUF5682 family protein [Promethearchaeota archaeon]